MRGRGRGRTGRRRARKKAGGEWFRRLDHEPALRELCAWLAARGCVRSGKLGFAAWGGDGGGGRGLVANRALRPGELLVDLPLHLTINLTTLLRDEPFCRLFADCAPALRPRRSLPLQALLALYLLAARARGAGSDWQMYLRCLPAEYALPYFLGERARLCLEPGIRAVVAAQRRAVKSSFDILDGILGAATRRDSAPLREKFTLREYEWAYFTVNTRCVYMDLSDIIDFDSIDNPILPLLEDNLTIALCPYLDMINHSSGVRTETKLVLQEITDASKLLKRIDGDSLADVRFHLYTMDRIDSFNEVFICYGDSHNLKLVTEYGFFLPSNELDSVNFDFEEIKIYLESKNLKLSQEQCSFIINHNLSKGLYIDNSGLSFNFYALLTVLKLYNNDKSNVSKIIYSPDDTGNSRSNLSNLILPLVNDKIVEIEESIANIKLLERESINLTNCLNLMQRYVDILKSLQK